MVRCQIIIILLAWIYLTHAVPPRYGKHDSCTGACNTNAVNVFGDRDVHIFLYSSEAISNEREESSTTAKFSTEVYISPLSSCENQMQLKNTRLYDSTDEEFENFRKHLETDSLLFRLENGQITALCSEPDEPVWVTNLKRGIISHFVLSYKDGISEFNVTETDISGQCETRYINSSNSGGILDLVKYKDLSKCKNRGHFVSGYGNIFDKLTFLNELVPLLNSHQTCHTNLTSTKRLMYSQCEEIHKLSPIYDQFDKAHTKIITRIRHYGLDSRRNFPEYITDGKRGIINFDSTDLKLSDESTENSIYKQLNYLDEQSKADIVTLEVPHTYSQLVTLLEKLSTLSLNKIFNSINSNQKDIMIEALSSLNSVDIAVFMIDSYENDLIAFNIFENWFSKFHRIRYPDIRVIHALAKLVQSKNTYNSMAYTLSQLVHTYCNDNRDCTNHPKIIEVIQLFESKFISQCFSPAYVESDNLLLTLKVLRNIPITLSGRNEIMKCVMEDKLKPFEQNIAIDALNQFICDINVRKFLFEILKNDKLELETRIASYSSLMKCTSEQDLSYLLTYLSTQQSTELFSFVNSHLSFYMNYNSSISRMMKATVGEDYFSAKNVIDKSLFSSQYFNKRVHFSSINMSLFFSGKIIFSPGLNSAKHVSLNVDMVLFGKTIRLLELKSRITGIEKWLHILLSRKEVQQNTYVKFVKDMLASRGNPSNTNENFYVMLKLIDFQIFENEFNNIDDLIENIDINSDYNFFDMIGNGINMVKNYIFLNLHYVAPTASGMPLLINAIGCSSMLLKSDVVYEISGFDTTNIHGHIRPSFATQISAGMFAKLYVKETGFQSTTNIYSSTIIKGGIELDNNRFISLRIDVPDEKIHLLNMNRNIYRVENLKRTQISLNDMVKEEFCTSSVIDTLLGVRYCSKVTHSKYNNKYLRFFHSLPFELETSIEKTDSFKYAVLQYKLAQFDSNLKFNFLIDTPNSNIKRMFLFNASYVRENNSFTCILKTPFKDLKFIGKFRQSPNLLLNFLFHVDNVPWFETIFEISNYVIDSTLKHLISFNLTANNISFISFNTNLESDLNLLKYNANMSLKSHFMEPLNILFDLASHNNYLTFLGSFEYNIYSLILKSNLKFFKPGLNMTNTLSYSMNNTEKLSFIFNLHLEEISDTTEQRKFTTKLLLQNTFYKQFDSIFRMWMTMNKDVGSLHIFANMSGYSALFNGNFDFNMNRLHANISISSPTFSRPIIFFSTDFEFNKTLYQMKYSLFYMNQEINLLELQLHKPLDNLWQRFSVNVTFTNRGYRCSECGSPYMNNYDFYFQVASIDNLNELMIKSRHIHNNRIYSKYSISTSLLDTHEGKYLDISYEAPYLRNVYLKGVFKPKFVGSHFTMKYDNEIVLLFRTDINADIFKANLVFFGHIFDLQWFSDIHALIYTFDLKYRMERFYSHRNVQIYGLLNREDFEMNIFGKSTPNRLDGSVLTSDPDVKLYFNLKKREFFIKFGSHFIKFESESSSSLFAMNGIVRSSFSYLNRLQFNISLFCNHCIEDFVEIAVISDSQPFRLKVVRSIIGDYIKYMLHFSNSGYMSVAKFSYSTKAYHLNFYDNKYIKVNLSTEDFYAKSFDSSILLNTSNPIEFTFNYKFNAINELEIFFDSNIYKVINLYGKFYLSNPLFDYHRSHLKLYYLDRIFELRYINDLVNHSLWINLTHNDIVLFSTQFNWLGKQFNLYVNYNKDYMALRSNFTSDTRFSVHADLLCSIFNGSIQFDSVKEYLNSSFISETNRFLYITGDKKFIRFIHNSFNNIATRSNQQKMDLFHLDKQIFGLNYIFNFETDLKSSRENINFSGIINVPFLEDIKINQKINGYYGKSVKLRSLIDFETSGKPKIKVICDFISNSSSNFRSFKLKHFLGSRSNIEFEAFVNNSLPDFNINSHFSMNQFKRDWSFYYNTNEGFRSLKLKIDIGSSFVNINNGHINSSFVIYLNEGNIIKLNGLIIFQEQIMFDLNASFNNRYLYIIFTSDDDYRFNQLNLTLCKIFSMRPFLHLNTTLRFIDSGKFYLYGSLGGNRFEICSLHHVNAATIYNYIFGNRELAIYQNNGIEKNSINFTTSILFNRFPLNIRVNFVYNYKEMFLLFGHNDKLLRFNLHFERDHIIVDTHFDFFSPMKIMFKVNIDLLNKQLSATLSRGHKTIRFNTYLINNNISDVLFMNFRNTFLPGVKHGILKLSRACSDYKCSVFGEISSEYRPFNANFTLIQQLNEIKLSLGVFDNYCSLYGIYKYDTLEKNVNLLFDFLLDKTIYKLKLVANSDNILFNLVSPFEGYRNVSFQIMKSYSMSSIVYRIIWRQATLESSAEIHIHNHILHSGLNLTIQSPYQMLSRFQIITMYNFLAETKFIILYSALNNEEAEISFRTNLKNAMIKITLKLPITNKWRDSVIQLIYDMNNIESLLNVLIKHNGSKNDFTIHYNGLSNIYFSLLNEAEQLNAISYQARRRKRSFINPTISNRYYLYIKQNNPYHYKVFVRTPHDIMKSVSISFEALPTENGYNFMSSISYNDMFANSTISYTKKSSKIKLDAKLKTDIPNFETFNLTCHIDFTSNIKSFIMFLSKNNLFGKILGTFESKNWTNGKLNLNFITHQNSLNFNSSFEYIIGPDRKILDIIVIKGENVIHLNGSLVYQDPFLIVKLQSPVRGYEVIELILSNDFTIKSTQLKQIHLKTNHEPVFSLVYNVSEDVGFIDMFSNFQTFELNGFNLKLNYDRNYTNNLFNLSLANDSKSLFSLYIFSSFNNLENRSFIYNLHIPKFGFNFILNCDSSLDTDEIETNVNLFGSVNQIKLELEFDSEFSLNKKKGEFDISFKSNLIDNDFDVDLEYEINTKDVKLKADADYGEYSKKLRVNMNSTNGRILISGPNDNHPYVDIRYDAIFSNEEHLLILNCIFKSIPLIVFTYKNDFSASLFSRGLVDILYIGTRLQMLEWNCSNSPMQISATYICFLTKYNFNVNYDFENTYAGKLNFDLNKHSVNDDENSKSNIFIVIDFNLLNKIYFNIDSNINSNECNVQFLLVYNSPIKTLKLYSNGFYLQNAQLDCTLKNDNLTIEYVYNKKMIFSSNFIIGSSFHSGNSKSSLYLKDTYLLEFQWNMIHPNLLMYLNCAKNIREKYFTIDLKGEDGERMFDYFFELEFANGIDSRRYLNSSLVYDKQAKKLNFGIDIPYKSSFRFEKIKNNKIYSIGMTYENLNFQHKYLSFLNHNFSLVMKKHFNDNGFIGHMVFLSTIPGFEMLEKNTTFIHINDNLELDINFNKNNENKVRATFNCTPDYKTFNIRIYPQNSPSIQSDIIGKLIFESDHFNGYLKINSADDFLKININGTRSMLFQNGNWQVSVKNNVLPFKHLFLTLTSSHALVDNVLAYTLSMKTNIDEKLIAYVYKATISPNKITESNKFSISRLDKQKTWEWDFELDLDKNSIIGRLKLHNYTNIDTTLVYALDLVWYNGSNDKYGILLNLKTPHIAHENYRIQLTTIIKSLTELQFNGLLERNHNNLGKINGTYNNHNLTTDVLIYGHLYKISVIHNRLQHGVFECKLKLLFPDLEILTSRIRLVKQSLSSFGIAIQAQLPYNIMPELNINISYINLPEKTILHVSFSKGDVKPTVISLKLDKRNDNNLNGGFQLSIEHSGYTGHLKSRMERGSEYRIYEIELLSSLSLIPSLKITARR